MTNNIQGNSHQTISCFSTETLQARREWYDILSDERTVEYSATKSTLPARLSFREKGMEKSKAFQISRS